jgi:thioesterase domain-containing protein
VPLEIRLFDAEVSNYKALWKYRPKKYSGNIELIRAKMKPSGWYSDPYMGWSQTILGQINTTEINGEHHSFIESPELGNVLAQQLQ